MPQTRTLPKARAAWMALAFLLSASFVLYFAVMTGAEFGEFHGRLEKKRYVQGAVLALAIAVTMGGGGTAFSRIGALLLAGVATAPVFPKGQMVVVWRDLPWLESAAMWIPQFVHFSLLPLFFVFYSAAPKPFIRARWSWVVWVPIIWPASWAARNLWAAVYRPSEVEGPPDWILFAAGAAVLFYGLGGMAALAANYWRTATEERAGWGFFVHGSIGGWTPGLLFLTAMFWGKFTASPLVWSLVSTPFRLFALAMFVLAPISLAHAGLTNQLFRRRDHPRFAPLRQEKTAPCGEPIQ